MSLQEIVDTYIAAWNETDAGKRGALIEKCWAAAGTYTDPMVDVSGRDALDETIVGFHEQMAGSRIVVSSGLDQHHDRVRFGWQLLQEDGTVRIEGIDVGQVDGDGRLLSILGFWGVSPPAG
ncbi:MAG TPA: nuclear transport factor 2 family protein [Dehalococcoidia bacterium]